MKKEINAKIATTKKFVNTHKTKIALVAGITAGAATALVIKNYIDDQKTTLRVTDKDAAYMHNGGSGAYATKYGTIYAKMNEPFSSTPE